MHKIHNLFIIQNAMRATIENGNGSPDLQPIKVTIVKGREDLSIKVRIFLSTVTYSNLFNNSDL